MISPPNGGHRFSSAGRTPLFAAVQRAMTIARIANQPGAPSVAELVERATLARQSRRDFLKATAGGMAAALMASIAAPRAIAGLPGSHRVVATPPISARKPARQSTGIAIVGAGLAGLNAAYTLKKYGIGSTLYSAPERIGGRTYSGHDILGQGLTTEIGGEFIDSGHVDMLSLANELGLGLYDVLGPSEAGLEVTYLFGGHHYSETQIIEAFRPLAARLDNDFSKVGGFPVTFVRKNAAAIKLDNTSLRAYLHQIGASGVISKLLEVAYVTEYGLESDQQPCLNLIFLIDTSTNDGFKVFGVSDQRYKIQGGNDLVAKGLAARVSDQIHTGHRLVAIQSRGSGYLLTFHQESGPTVQVSADVAVLAIPFTLLRDVDIDVPLPAFKRNAIANLGYGANTKLFTGYNGRPWRNHGLTGDSFTDQGYQLSWDNSRPQPSAFGGMTMYLGGSRAVAAGAGSDTSQVMKYLPGLDLAFPGTMGYRNGTAGRAYWPGEPYVKASYAAYQVGQYTTIAGAEIRPVGNLFFAGEHCSLDYQGYMNGAASTGRTAAESVVNLLRN